MSATAPDEAAPQPIPQPAPEVPAEPQSQGLATLGAGCFWCIEAVLEQLDGVLEVVSGYMGGHVPDPTYRQVCSGETGHAEVVQVRFDPARLGYDELLGWFWLAHDPTQKDRQGDDVGTQYRSAIFFHSPEQQAAAELSRAREEASGRHPGPIVTEIAPGTTFYPAEQDHQDYYRRNPSAGYCRMIIAPKLEGLGLKK